MSQLGVEGRNGSRNQARLAKAAERSEREHIEGMPERLHSSLVRCRKVNLCSGEDIANISQELHDTGSHMGRNVVVLSYYSDPQI